MLLVTVVIHSIPQSPTHSTTILHLIEILHRNLILLYSPTHRTTKQIQHDTCAPWSLIRHTQ
jgi:hypothetical protein